MSQSSSIYIEFILHAQTVKMPKIAVPSSAMCSLVEEIRYRHKRNYPTMENMLLEAVEKLKRRGEREREGEKRILLIELCSPPNSYVETLIPKVTVFGYGGCEEVIKVQ